MQRVFETATNATLRCSLNIDIPASMTITWMLDGVALPPSNAARNDQTTILRLGSLPRNGVYQCIFNDTVGYILRRSITLVGMCTDSDESSKNSLGLLKRAWPSKLESKVWYCAAQNFGGRKLWRISSELPKFYPPNSVNSRISESLFKQPPKFYPPIISHY